MERDTPNRRVGIDQRAQSVFDFSIGVSLFLVVVFGVFAFVPTAFGSFGGGPTGAAGDGLAADRSADHFTKTILDSKGPDAGFDTDCAILFFSDDPSHSDIDVSRPDCELDGSRSGSLTGKLSLSPTRRVNITVESDFGSGRKIACWDSTDGEVMSSDPSDCGDDSDDVKFGAGSSAVDNPDFATTERYGTIDGTNVHVVVRVW